MEALPNLMPSAARTWRPGVPQCAETTQIAPGRGRSWQSFSRGRVKVLDSMAIHGRAVAHKEDWHLYGRCAIAHRHETGDSRRNLEYKMLCNFPRGVAL